MTFPSGGSWRASDAFSDVLCAVTLLDGERSRIEARSREDRENIDDGKLEEGEGNERLFVLLDKEARCWLVAMMAAADVEGEDGDDREVQLDEDEEEGQSELCLLSMPILQPV